MASTIRFGFVVGICAAVSACTLPYYWQAATGQFELVRRRVPIEKVLEDPAQPPAVKASLRRVLEMRRFAVDVLDLPDNDSYRSYADLRRPFVVWNVVAAAEFDVEPVQWCFALIGCVSYRGYFSREAADAFAAGLEDDGYDIYVAGASAYSTLGYFDDPVLNTMLAGGDAYVAGVLFHELAHQKFYVKGDSDLNEAFATAVQLFGTVAWLAEHGAPEDVDAFYRSQQRQDDFTEIIAAQRERLVGIYTSSRSPAGMRLAKSEAFERMRADYARAKAAWGGVSEYDAWFAQSLNNAQLASVSTYRRWLPGLQWYLEGNGLPALYREMATLAGQSEAEREQRLTVWLEAANETAVTARR